jgi:hypothetical protein
LCRSFDLIGSRANRKVGIAKYLKYHLQNDTH